MLLCAVWCITFTLSSATTTRPHSPHSKCVPDKTIVAFDYSSAIQNPPTGKIVTLADLTSGKDTYVVAVFQGTTTNLCKHFADAIKDISIISVTETPLKTIDKGIFDGLKTLEDFELDTTDFEHIEAGVFQNIPNLEELTFTTSPINTIDDGAFNHLPKLEKFSVTKAKLQTVKSAWFVNCPKIKFVDFSHNNLRVLHGGDFGFLVPGVPHIVKLEGNKIKTIEDGAFSSKRFALLDLQSNKLRALRHSMFTKLRRSEKIDLSDNRFTCVDELTLRFLKVFSSINLNDNSAEDSCDKFRIKDELTQLTWD